MVWNSIGNSIKEALDLPLGRIGIDMGLCVECLIRSDKTLIAAYALKEYYLEYPYDDSIFVIKTQAELIMKAQEVGLAFAESPKFVLTEE